MITLPQFRIRRRVWVAAGLLVAVTLAWRYWTRVGATLPGPVAKANPAFVQVAGQRQDNQGLLLQERTDLFDPTPLFLPTEKNYGQGGLPANVVRQPGQVFGTYDPQWRFRDESVASLMDHKDKESIDLNTIISRGDGAPFSGFAQIDVKRPDLPERAGYIEVKSLNNSGINLSEALNQDGLPKRDYAPAEFVVSISAGGVLGVPVLTSGTGSDEIDATLRDYLIKIYRLGERLPPGCYAVAIGP